MMDLPVRSGHKDETVRNAFRDVRALICKDTVHAKDALTELAEKGCTEAMVCLGVMYLDNGTAEERDTAVSLFNKAAELGDHRAMRNLGYIHAVGIHVGTDKRTAAEWYTRSAKAGNPKAQCNIGVMYHYGNGVPKDPAEAVKWFSMSAVNGYSRGQTNLGIMLLEGEGIGKDPVTAAYMFAESGSPRAKFYLARQYLAGDGVARDRDKAMCLLNVSAAEGYSKAAVLLASLTEGTDMKRSTELYKQAASKGNVDAAARLKELDIPCPEPIPRKRRRSK
ncbi:MAG: sel1 repeat family protein [Methanomassiliicoccaceae archaeon]|nr:sel1 repeat family protein [Methanomassiliicoccaceae archaeon]